MSKKIISLLLAVMLTVSMLTVAVVSVSAEEGAEATYIVAGSEEVFGSKWGWADEANLMTDEDGDGIYTLVLTEVGPFTNAQFKIGNGVNEEGSIGPMGDGTNSPESKFNFQFNIDDTCDVTITFNPATYEVTYTGDYVSEYVFSVEELRAVGNGGSGWLNDVPWDPAADENLMEEIAPGVYQLVMVDVEGKSSAELKFAADGSWGTNWGAAEAGTVYGFDETLPLTYNGQNMGVVIGTGDDDENLYTVTITVDLTNFNDSTKEGATVLLKQEVQSEEEPTEETTEESTEEPTEETTEQPTEETTVAPAGAPLTVNATSNFFSKAEAQYNAETNKVVVSYYLESDKNILNFQIGTKEASETALDGITYDPEILKVSEDWTNKKTVPMLGGTAGATINLRGVAGSIKLNGSNLNLWEVNPEKPFVQVEFDVLDLTGKGPVTTTIGCEVESMIVADLNADEEVDAETEDYLIKDKIANEANIAKNNVKATTTLTESTYVPVDPTEEPTTEVSTPDEPTTEESTPDEPTTEVAGNVVTAMSNVFPTEKYEAEVGETISVDFLLNANVLSTQWALTYDPTVLELVTTNNYMPQMTAGALYNDENAGIVEGSASSLDLYNVTADQPFVTAQFKKIAEGDTTVTLYVQVLQTAELNEDGTVNEDSEAYVVWNGQVNDELVAAISPKTIIGVVVEEPTTEEPTTEEPTTEEPTTEESTTEEPTTVEVPTQPTTGAGSSTSDTPTAPAGTADTPTNNNGNGAVQTGDASMAIIILSVLVAGTAVMFVLRKREMF